MEHKVEKDKCKSEIQVLRDYREGLPEIVEKLVGTCNHSDSFDHVSSEPIPSRDAIIEIIRQCQRILFPGYFIPTRLDSVNLQYYLGQEIISLFEELSRQIALCIRYDCIRHNLPCTHCEERGQEDKAAANHGGWASKRGLHLGNDTEPDHILSFQHFSDFVRHLRRFQPAKFPLNFRIGVLDKFIRNSDLSDRAVCHPVALKGF